jgi:succinate dehydrogenase/fumarate reductase flavoprotein subunit
MVWPTSVRGILVTEGVRGDGGTLKNNKDERFMFRYVPDFFRSETAETEEEADKWYEDKKNNRRTPDLLPRDEVARAINAEVKAGRGSPHGGVFLDIASRRSADYIKRRLPSMYHQFMELADVDITKTAMEVGPTLHYIMGGVRVDADSTQSTVPGLFAAGEVAAGMHGANRLGGNSLSDLLVFGRRAGLYAAEYAKRVAKMPRIDDRQVDAAATGMLAPFERREGENPVRRARRSHRNDARARRDHPHARGAGGGDHPDRPPSRACDARRGQGLAHLQPWLAPRARSAHDADRLGSGRDGRADAAGEPRRAHARRLPEARPGVGQEERRRSPA